MGNLTITNRTAALLVIALCLATSTALVRAQAGGTPDAAGELGTGYDMSWFTVDGGGGTVSGGGYTLVGTAGQSDPGMAMRGGEYTLIGGFWEGAETGNRIYLPLVMRNRQ